jgi:hypothetical protein
MVTTLVSRLRAWLSQRLAGDLMVVKAERAVRAAQSAAAQELGLERSVGATAWEDRASGSLGPYPVVISYAPNYDVQKPETVITLGPAKGAAARLDLGREELLAAYDESVRRYGASSAGALSAEQRAWLAGHRLGIGAQAKSGCLVYRQLFGVEEPASIVLVCKALVVVLAQLDAAGKG